MKDFRRLNVWEKSHTLVLNIYKICETFPKKEEFRLTNQMIRAAYSIPSNIAEGCVKATDPEFKRYLNISMGSASELEYFILLAHDLKYIKKEDLQPLVSMLAEVQRMLMGLFKSKKP